MHRIASALLITGVVLALNAGMLRDAFAAPLPDGRVETLEKPRVGSAKLLSLLIVLETLRQNPAAGVGQKV